MVLTRLSRYASRFEIDYLRSKGANFQTLVESIRGEPGTVYCAVASHDHRFQAHSDVTQKGRKAADPLGDRQRIGQIERIRYEAPTGQPMAQYRIPLLAGAEHVADLWVGTNEPGALGLFLSAAEFLPFAVLSPLLLLGLGAVFIHRAVRPLADVDSQLAAVATEPIVSDADLRPVKVRGAASLGWNRLVHDLTSDRYPVDLQQRLNDRAESRHRRTSDDWLNSIPEGIAITDREGSISFANRAFCALAGWQTDQPVPDHRSVADCFALQSFSPDDTLLQSTAMNRNVVSEVVQETASGDRYLRLGRFPIRAEEPDEQSRHIWMVRDVTPQRLADRMRDEFLDSATHELRTPLSNIKAYAETLALSDVMEVEQQKEFCNTINTESTRLARLIDDLLSVSSMESGSLAITRQTVNLMRLLQEAADKIRAQMDQKQIQFETILPPKLPELSLDKDKFVTTLVNLLGNAAKYTPAGGRVAFKARVGDRRLVIDIEDSGIGISEQERAQVFDKFFRSKDGRVQAETGTGLGLSLAQEIIRLHGGSLQVRSQLNEGSTFTISLPLGKTEEVATPVTTAS